MNNIDLYQKICDSYNQIVNGITQTESNWGYAHPKKISKEDSDKLIKSGLNTLKEVLEYFEQKVKETDV
jgi:hypothetical protein